MTPAVTERQRSAAVGTRCYRSQSVKGCPWLPLRVGGSHDAGVSLRMGQFPVPDSLEASACAGFFGKRFEVCTL